MKKLLALSLAALMVMGLSVSAFAKLYEGKEIVPKVTFVGCGDNPAAAAVSSIGKYGYLVNDDGNIGINSADPYEGRSNTVAPGDTIYIPLKAYNGGNEKALVTNADAVKSITLKQSWILGRDAVESVKVVYKKYVATAAELTALDVNAATSGYAYFVAFTMKDSTSTAAKDISLDLTVKKASGTLKENDISKDLKIEFECRVDFACAYNRMNENSSGYEYLIKSAYQVFDGKDEDGEQTFEFDKDPDSYFEVDVTGQTKVLLRADVKYNATVAAKYPAASLDFFNGSGSFNKIGLLYLAAEEDTYLYVLNSDGTLSKSNAEYDGSHFIIKTRSLGSYVISDRELEVAAPVTETPSASTAPEAPAPAPSSSTPVAGTTPDAPKTNPGTGAIA